jgi:hypothetical protein
MPLVEVKKKVSGTARKRCQEPIVGGEAVKGFLTPFLTPDTFSDSDT